MKKIVTKYISFSVVILSIIIFLGFFWRLQTVITNTFAFTYDVGRDMLALADIVQNHKISLIGFTTGLEGVFYGPWWYWLLTPAFYISGGNPQGISLFIVLCGMLAVVGGFVLGKKITNNFLGLVFAAFLSFAPIMFGITTQIWNPNLAPLLIILSFLSFYQIDLSRKNLWQYFLYLGLLLMLIVESEIVFGILLAGGFVLGFLVLKRKYLTFLHIVSFFAGMFVILLPRIIFEFRHDFLMTNTIMTALTNTKGGNFSFLSNIPHRVTVLDTLWNESLAAGSFFWGTLFLILMIAIFIYYFKKIKANERVFMALCGFIIVSFLVGLSFFQHDIWPHYLVGLPIIFFLLFSLALSTCYRYGYQRTTIVCTIFILFIAINPVRIISDLTVSWVGDASVYRNQLGVVDYIYSDAQGKNFKYIVYTPPVHDYTYQYLFSWYGKKQYHYVSSEKSELAYFILEPDKEIPDRLTNWLITRKNDGKVVKEITLPGGIIVQTRINKL